MKGKKFPAAIFVSRTNGGTDEEYLDAHEDAAECVEDDGPTRVATYKLVEVLELSKYVVSKPSE